MQAVCWILAAVALFQFIVLPIGYIVANAVIVDGKLSFALLKQHLLEDPRTVEATINSIALSVGVAVMSVVVGVPLALGVNRTDMLGKGLVRTSIIVAIITPPFLRTMAYILLLGPNAGYVNVFLRKFFFPALESGPINVFSFLALVLLATPTGIAHVFIFASVALNRMDPSLEETARISGANRFQTIWNITLKIASNGVWAGALMAFASSLALYGTPHMLGINVLTTRIKEALLMPVDFELAAVVSALVLVISVFALNLYRRVTRDTFKYQTVSGKGFRPRVIPMGKVRHVFTTMGLLYGFLSFILPYGTLIHASFLRTFGVSGAGNFTLANYKYIFTEPYTVNAIKNSLYLAVVTATVCLVLAILVGYIVIRTNMWGRGALDYVSILPMGISGTALAIGLLFAYTSPMFRGLRLYGTLGILFLAYVARQLPVSVRNTQTSLMQIGKELEEAARVSGATWLRTMAKIILPLVKDGLLYAWIMVFLGVLPEISASIILRHIGTDTVATAILDLWSGAAGFQRAAALGSASFILVASVFLLAQKLTGRSIFDLRGN